MIWARRTNGQYELAVRWIRYSAQGKQRMLILKIISHFLLSTGFDTFVNSWMPTRIGHDSVWCITVCTPMMISIWYLHSSSVLHVYPMEYRSVSSMTTSVNGFDPWMKKNCLMIQFSLWWLVSHWIEISLDFPFSDHGHRFARLRETHQGQLEERLPFYSFTLPKALRDTQEGAKVSKQGVDLRERKEEFRCTRIWKWTRIDWVRPSIFIRHSMIFSNSLLIWIRSRSDNVIILLALPWLIVINTTYLGCDQSFPLTPPPHSLLSQLWPDRHRSPLVHVSRLERCHDHGRG